MLNGCEKGLIDNFRQLGRILLEQGIGRVDNGTHHVQGL